MLCLWEQDLFFDICSSVMVEHSAESLGEGDWNEVKVLNEW